MLGTTFRLVDVPDMDYLSTDQPPRGEIWIRGPNVSSGYFKNPEATAASFKPGGFFATGDIGRLDPDGTITIVDRKKNLFKLAQGEYLALEFLETVYCRAPQIAQIWVWGDSFANFLVAAVVPNWDVTEPELKARLGDACPATREEMCKDARVKKYILDRMEVAANDAKLLSYQRAKAILLESQAWTIEGNLLTPTFKIRRTQLLAKYEPQMRQLCAEYQQQQAAKSSSK
jgi:long-chain acyl-CoA synthetase